MNEPACIEVERLGGFAGFGLPGSGLRSRGKVLLASLSAADLAATDALFAHPPKPDSSSGAADRFRYRLMRHAAAGCMSIEVDEQHVPAVLRDCVIDGMA
jgi:hypothetical protein